LVQAARALQTVVIHNLGLLQQQPAAVQAVIMLLPHHQAVQVEAGRVQVHRLLAQAEQVVKVTLVELTIQRHLFLLAAAAVRVLLGRQGQEVNAVQAVRVQHHLLQVRLLLTRVAVAVVLTP
jgi:hypothetical protein